MKNRITDINVFLLALSILCFWYISFSFERGFIGLRGSRFELSGSPFLFWSGITFVAGVACYLLYLIFFGKEDDDIN